MGLTYLPSPMAVHTFQSHLASLAHLAEATYSELLVDRVRKVWSLDFQEI